MSRQSDALRDYIKINRIKQIELAELLGISQTTVSNLLSGRYTMSNEHCEKLAERYGFDLLFLLTGKGELFAEAKPARSDNENNDKAEAKEGDNFRLRIENIRLSAENAQLRQELEWLRSMVKGMIPAPQV